MSCPTIIFSERRLSFTLKGRSHGLVDDEVEGVSGGCVGVDRNPRYIRPRYRGKISRRDPTDCARALKVQVARFAPAGLLRRPSNVTSAKPFEKPRYFPLSPVLIRLR